jgi:ferrous iron transport protein B
MLAVGALAARLLPGRRSEFLLEVPPLRRPQLGNIAVKTGARIGWYLREAVPLFVVGTLILFTLDRLQALGALTRAGEPLVTGWLGLPAESASAFLIGFLRRDFAATQLFSLAGRGQLDTVQIVVSMVTVTLFVPCVANVLVIVKERGLRAGAAMVAVIFPIAFLVGGLVARAMRAVPGSDRLAVTAPILLALATLALGGLWLAARAKASAAARGGMAGPASPGARRIER